MNAFVADVFDLCRTKGRLEGEFKVAELPRLAQESIEGAGVLKWALQGGIDMRGYPQLTLMVAGNVRLVCQRCLSPFDFGVSSEAVIVVAVDEASADEIDELLADEPVEVIVGSKTFDISVLIEDEALLILPSSPKHEVCPGLPLPNKELQVEKESPFAMLKTLKQ